MATQMNDLLQSIYYELGINASHLSNNKLVRCEQPTLQDLEVVEIDHEGRPFVLHKAAANAWRQMCLAASKDNVALKPFSGFRSYLHQRQLIKRKLDSGGSLDLILTETAIPGFSEHHTGCAVDICTSGRLYLKEDFEDTSAFTWLKNNAQRFSFHLSYPRENAKGIVYEPWHWYFRS